MTDLTVNTDGAKEVKQHLDAIKDKIKEASGEWKGLLQERDMKLTQLADEQKKFGGEFGDTKAKVDEISKKFADILEFNSKAQSAIEKLETRLKTPSGNGSDDGKDEMKRARFLAEVKHYSAAKAISDKLPAFDEKSMSQTFLDEAKAYDGAFDKFMRQPHYSNNADALGFLDQGERKSISTMTHGNQIWLPLTMTNAIVRCFEEETDLTAFVSSQTISNAGMQFLRENQEAEEAQWECEMSCNEKQIDIDQPNMTTIMAHQLRAKVCCTNAMLEDAAFDLESYIAGKAGEAFVRSRNRGILTGTGNGMPHGGLKQGNHVEMASGNVAGTASGHFTWQDLVALKWKHDTRFMNSRSWWMDRDAAAATFTMSDGEGRPIWSESMLAASIAASGINGPSHQGARYGIPSLLGIPAYVITQMPKYIDSGTGNRIIGNKPIGLGDWKKWYTMVERKGFSVLRDPFSKASCNSVVWHFYMRAGGDVLCSNAALFLKIV
ncbi:MAG: phage major capsid protein [Beijerinckiaceae bacterium]